MSDNRIHIKNNFKERIKFREDLEMKKLLDIQRILEDGRLRSELAKEATNDLTNEQKNNLLQLYKTRINELEQSLRNYKKRILAIKKKI